MNFPSQIFFNDINHGYKAALLKKNYLWLLLVYVDVSSYCCHEKGRRTNKYFHSFLVAELNNIENEDKVFAQECSCEESDF